MTVTLPSRSMGSRMTEETVELWSSFVGGELVSDVAGSGGSSWRRMTMMIPTFNKAIIKIIIIIISMIISVITIVSRTIILIITVNLI